MGKSKHITVSLRSEKCKGDLQLKNDLDLYSSLVLLINIGMYDLVMLAAPGALTDCSVT